MEESEWGYFFENIRTCVDVRFPKFVSKLRGPFRRISSSDEEEFSSEDIIIRDKLRDLPNSKSM